MDSELKSLRIDSKRRTQKTNWSTRWIVGGIALFLLLGAARLIYGRLNQPLEVATAVVPAPVTTATSSSGTGVSILDATGYIVAAHKIKVAAKVVGKVAWIGVDKGDKVKEGQVIVRLEDDEYKAQLLQTQGNLAALKARLAEAMNGSRPEEISRANADMEQAKADLENARINLNRTKALVQATVVAKQQLDDAQAKYDSAENRVKSLQRTLDLLKIGPRKEQIDALRGSLLQAEGQLEYAQTQVNNTVIRAPVTGTILERNVEKGEFVTTGFASDQGAKGYVVSLADLNDLEVELDINQNDFAKLHFGHKATLFTDAFPDRKYQGDITEISPEANRQKATVQVKVKVRKPDDFLRPEMNATVQFQDDAKPTSGAGASLPSVIIPANAIRNDAVFIINNGHAQRRSIRTAGNVANGVRVEGGLTGGETLILEPPATLKDGDPVKPKA